MIDQKEVCRCTYKEPERVPRRVYSHQQLMIFVCAARNTRYNSHTATIPSSGPHHPLEFQM